MLRLLAMSIALTFPSSLALGCGLDWTLPHAQFNGIEEHGYVAYWEKIGEVDLGDGLTISININFNSHRESSSPSLGKGWTVALLESHVEPIDENSMNVIMPDGWTYIFYRNGNTETWRGTAGWVGETNNTLFTITAPCGWRIKYDGGKIQEIDSKNNRALSYKYNGLAATEVDADGKPFVQLEYDGSTGVTQDILVDGRKISVTQAQRPRIVASPGGNLIVNFDQSLNQLVWPDGRKETFAFGGDKALNPNLTIARLDSKLRVFTWDAETKVIKADGVWEYTIREENLGGPAISRKNNLNQEESWSRTSPGEITEEYLDGAKEIVDSFASGPLNGKIRKITCISPAGKSLITYQASYNEDASLLREEKEGLTYKYGILANGETKTVDIYKNDVLQIHREYNTRGYLTKIDDRQLGQSGQELAQEISKNLALGHISSN